jgi:ATP-dependent DNA ligase
MCFDLLHVDGHNLADETYETRRRELERLGVTQGRWLTTPSPRNSAGAALYGYTLTHGWEDVLAKRLYSTYRPASRDGGVAESKAPARARSAGRSSATATLRLTTR